MTYTEKFRLGSFDLPMRGLEVRFAPFHDGAGLFHHHALPPATRMVDPAEDAAFEIEKPSQTKPPAPLTHASRAHHEAPVDRPSGAVLEDGKVALIADHRAGVHEPLKLGRVFIFPSALSFRPIFVWDNQLVMALRCR